MAQYSSNLYQGETQGTATSEAIYFQGPVGRIQALVDTPKADRGEAVGIVCHPHPLFGGSYQNKVVHTLARTFNRLGMPAVRFNFRGVGETEGEYDEGVGETDDLLAVADALAQYYPGRQLWLSGFSFGAYVALRGCSQRAFSRLVTVAPAVHLYDFSTLALPEIPWILVQGDEDEVVPSDEVRAWVDGLRQRPEVLWMEGTGHFFHGHLTQLRDELLDRLSPAVVD